MIHLIFALAVICVVGIFMNHIVLVENRPIYAVHREIARGPNCEDYKLFFLLRKIPRSNTDESGYDRITTVRIPQGLDQDCYNLIYLRDDFDFMYN